MTAVIPMVQTGPSKYRAPLREKPNPNGVVLYEGPSMLDGAPIVVIASGLRADSDNGKTGAMIQTFIMRQDVNPVDALKTGEDASVCGSCIHRPLLADQTGDPRCYVVVFQAPRSVWDCWKRGGYRHATEADRIMLSGRSFRFGTYGDPMAVPLAAWPVAPGRRTGYSHQWEDDSCQTSEYKKLLMASVDSGSEYMRARANGWRSFRVESNPYNPMMPGEVVCPASEEGGKRATCDTCGLCSGNRWEGRGRVPASVRILDHSTAGRARNRRLAVIN